MNIGIKIKLICILLCSYIAAVGQYSFPEYVSNFADANSASTTGSIQVSYPEGVQEGDWLILIYASQSHTNPSAPSGFTSRLAVDNSGVGGRTDDLSARMCYKRATGSETGSVTISGFTSSVRSSGSMYLYRNVTPAGVSPFVGNDETNTDNSSTLTIDRNEPNDAGALTTIYYFTSSSSDYTVEALTGNGRSTIVGDYVTYSGVSDYLRIGEHHITAAPWLYTSSGDYTDALGTTVDYITMSVSVRTDNQPYSLPRGLISCWEFNETSGTTANDAVGGENNGTYINTPLLQQSTVENLTYSVDFNGINEYVQIPDDASLDGYTSMTYCGWFKTDTNGVIIAKQNDASGTGTDDSYSAYIVSNIFKIEITTAPGNTITLEATSTVVDNNWHHFIVVYDGSNVKLYIDSNLEDTDLKTGNINTTNENVYIGVENNNGTLDEYFKGKIDHVQIWDRALTETEITKLYQARRGRPYNNFYKNIP